MADLAGDELPTKGSQKCAQRSGWSLTKLARGHPSLRTHLGQRCRIKTVLVLSLVEDREAESEVSMGFVHAIYYIRIFLLFKGGSLAFVFLHQMKSVLYGRKQKLLRHNISFFSLIVHVVCGGWGGRGC